jgi:hypothetical protein
VQEALAESAVRPSDARGDDGRGPPRAEELLERARRDIAAEREPPLDAVRRETVDLAIAAAEKLVRRNLDTEDNRRLVRDYLARSTLREPAAGGV